MSIYILERDVKVQEKNAIELSLNRPGFFQLWIDVTRLEAVVWSKLFAIRKLYARKIANDRIAESENGSALISHVFRILFSKYNKNIKKKPYTTLWIANAEKTESHGHYAITLL